MIDPKAKECKVPYGKTKIFFFFFLDFVASIFVQEKKTVYYPKFFLLCLHLKIVEESRISPGNPRSDSNVTVM